MSRPLPFQSHQRRQARPSIRVAAGWDSCVRGIELAPRPPHPPSVRGAAADGGIQGSRGAAHSFCQCRGTVRAAKTRGWPPRKCENPHGSKRRARFGLVEIPQVAMSFPHVTPFSPYVGFWWRRPDSSLLLLLFKREREGEEGAKTGKRPSTGYEKCYWKYPRVVYAIHRFSVACFLGETVVWRWFAGDLRGNPRSTAGNAWVPPVVFDIWGAYGE